ncbi:MAG: putative rane protein [Micrococcaceae bacterium]|nr:putative rane protein [Micrococcaceae bacterium]
MAMYWSGWEGCTARSLYSITRVMTSRVSGMRLLIGQVRQMVSGIGPRRGMQSLQRGRLFGHHEWLVVGKHDASGTDADGVRPGSNGGHQHGRNRTGDPWHRVVLCDPEAVVTPFLGPLGPFQHPVQGVRSRKPFPGVGTVENGNPGYQLPSSGRSGQNGVAIIFGLLFVRAGAVTIPCRASPPDLPPFHALLTGW